MLIILPPSETKLPPPESGSPLDLDRLSFPSLTAMRERVMDALVATSQRPDALRRLFVRPSLAGEVARNEHLRDLPTRSAVDTYAGPLYEGLDAGSWSSHAEKRAARQLVIVSALWGAVRPADRIPPYRLYVCARLVGIDRLEPAWRSLLPPILTDAATRRGPVLDLRSRAYQAVGRPTGLDDQTVTLRIRPSPGGPGSHRRCHRETGSWRGGKPRPVVGGRSGGSPGHRRRPRHTLVARGRSARRTEPNLDDHAPVRRMRCREAAVIGQPGFPLWVQRRKRSTCA